MAVLQDIAQALIKGDANKVKSLVQTALDEGVRPGQIIQEGLIPGMSVIGDRFKRNEVYVPEVLIAARAMHAGLDIVKPLLAEGEVQATGVFVIGTVKGDLHDIGKNLVAMMMEGAGFKVIDLGVDVAPDKFVAAVKEHDADVVGMSALLTTTMVNMKDTVKAFEDAGLRDKVKIIIGGAPVTQNYCAEITADGYAPDASSAVDVAKELIGVN
ncbi:MAG: corrinoid protein [Limnochordia bacterium]|jgi:5-methyltetrahydrofolate--homocysteine methyltransferase|nr:corrinoid protein [Limnochordia bacterium]MDD2628831.1 corrinoid protein [Limnochordia bacterium]MDD2756694.1 corrinoid protein [Methanothrix sp.]MDD4518506.1 corrinoid protein [Limnochordia bacterium]